MSANRKALYRPRDLGFRAAGEEDGLFLYELLVERYASGVANIEGMAAPQLPSLAEHLAHLASRPYRRIEIVTVGAGTRTDVGMLYLTSEQVGGCFILRRYAGRGIALAAGLSFFGSCQFPVTVHFNPMNRPGWRAAVRLGWTLVERLPNRLTYELRGPPIDPFTRLEERRPRG